MEKNVRTAEWLLDIRFYLFIGVGFQDRHPGRPLHCLTWKKQIHNMIMNETTLTPKEGIRLRKIGNQYMIVDVSKENVNMSDVYSLNHTAALLWQRIEDGDATPDKLADSLCETYGIGKEDATRDVERQIDDWRQYGLLR